MRWIGSTAAPSEPAAAQTSFCFGQAGGSVQVIWGQLDVRACVCECVCHDPSAPGIRKVGGQERREGVMA